MASLLTKLQKNMTAAGIKPRTQQARAWIGQQLRNLKIPNNRSNILNDPTRAGQRAVIGRMFFFHYDAKYKDELPVWDKFPLVLPMEVYPDGFLGLNLHYLDPYNRLYLLDLLHDFLNNDKYDNSTRFKLSYQVLNASKRYRVMQPCIKRYLFSHITSQMVYIEPDSWETAIFLPTEKMVYNS
jgi:hypothetical protein